MEEPKFEPVPEETAEAPAEPAALPAADEALIPEMPEEPAAPAEDPMVEVCDVQFRSGSKVYFFAPGELKIATGDEVILETARGPEFGQCVRGNHMVHPREVTPPLRPILRLATQQDKRVHAENCRREKRAMDVCQQKIADLGLEMQLVSAEYTCTLESFGMGEHCMLRAEERKLVHKPGELGVSFHVAGLMDFDVEVPMPGKFSVYNALAAIAICRHFKVDEENIKKALLQAKVKGRIEMIKVSDQFTLLIDYAHNAMALESLLTTLREYEPHRLISLFGCGGNRSRQRRFEMGEVSGKLADLTIITSDNPRFEEPQDIIDDIKTGMAKTDGNYVEICDRKEAITYAIEHGEPGDIIVLAGKGHEDYQEIRGVKHPMDERDLIRDILAEGHIPGSAAK